MVQVALTPFVNRNLFSNHYLETLLHGLPEWNSDAHVAPFAAFQALMSNAKPFLSGDRKESQLEEHFLRPAFSILGLSYEVQESTHVGSDSPDYVFFASAKERDEAHQRIGTRSFFDKSVAIGEAKKWDHALDRIGRDRHDKRRNPSFQIWLYLQETGLPWGVLTNGRKWRIVRRDKPLDVYYEVDLPALVDGNDVAGFRFFYYFFCRDAFVAGITGRPFLERVFSGSIAYALDIGENLKENVFGALRILAQGFVDFRSNKLSPDKPQDLSLIQQNTLRLLYRLLFVLYAEGKGLLSDAAYLGSQYSFDGLKREVARSTDAGNVTLPTSTGYWNRLQDLFELIDKGSEGLRIPRDEFFVPAYNGGLFDTSRNDFLFSSKVGDRALSAAIDLLSRAPDDSGRAVFVDYSTLDIRHLGSIYEGLLEYRLSQAREDMVAIGDALSWTPYRTYEERTKDPVPFDHFPKSDRAAKGELLVETHKGERRLTGSYYTPSYIVSLIVQRALGPLLNARLEEAREKRTPGVRAVLSFRVVDPSMGSGHFLVGAVEFLSAKLLQAVQQDLENGTITEDEAAAYTTDHAKREVLAHCIYGADLNELAVELAKVSLWLTTISRDKPLSFLDHKLKRGNSLLGAVLSDLKDPPGARARRKTDQALPNFVSELFIKRLLAKMFQIEALSDDNLSEVRQKGRLLAEFFQLREYSHTRALCNLSLSAAFGNKIAPGVRRSPKEIYYDLIFALGTDKEWSEKTTADWFKAGQEAAEERGFFHWELEFPDVFFEGGRIRENPGFDAVIGNPPYVNAWELFESDKGFREMVVERYQFQQGHWDLYTAFIERGLSLLRLGGSLGYIVPMGFSNQKYGRALRLHVASELQLLFIGDFRDVRVFPDADTKSIVIHIHNMRPKEDAQIEILRYAEPPSGPLPVVTSTLALPQVTVLEDGEKAIRLSLTPEGLAVWKHIHSRSLPLVNLCYVNAGAVSHSSKLGLRKKDFVSTSQRGAKSRAFIDAKDVSRYHIAWKNLYLEYDRDVLHIPMFPQLFEADKIVCRDISWVGHGLDSAVDRGKLYCTHTLTLVVPYCNLENVRGEELEFSDTQLAASRRYSIDALQAILASKFMAWYFKEFVAAETLQGPWSHLYPGQIEQFPVPVLDFEGAQGSAPEILARGETQLRELISAPPRRGGPAAVVSSVVNTAPKAVRPALIHQLLAWASREMSTLATQQAALGSSFRDWLTSPAGLAVNLEQLTNRALFDDMQWSTDIGTNAHLASLERVFQKNRIRLTATQLAAFRDQYRTAASPLGDAQRRFAALDATVDQLVYAAFSLSSAQIQVVESVAPSKDSR